MLTRSRTSLPAPRDPHGQRDPFTSAFAGLREMQEAMEGFFGDLYRGSWRERGFLGMGMNAYQSGDTYTIECALPGVERKNIHLTVVDDCLTVKATFNEHEEAKHEEYDLHELRCGEMTRELRLPFEVDPQKVEATFVDGLLRIRLACKASPLLQRHTIEVRG